MARAQAALTVTCGSTADSASDQPQVGINVSLSPTYPARGDSVTLKLTNGEAGQIGYNLCTARLVRGASGAGEQVPEDRFCTAELRILPPGGVDSVKLQLPDTLSAPSYRYIVSVERQS